MKKTQVLMMTVCVLVLIGCGGASQEQPAASAETQVVQPTPASEMDFESGEAETAVNGEEAQAEDEATEEVPSE